MKQKCSLQQNKILLLILYFPRFIKTRYPQILRCFRRAICLANSFLSKMQLNALLCLMSFLCCSVTLQWPVLCNPMDCSTPGFPVLHYLPKSARTHVHCVCDTTHPSHPLFSSVQFCHSVLSDSLQPHGQQHTRPPCPSPTPRVYSNSCPLSQ